MEFLYNARKLEIFTIKKCISFPKRYTFYIGQEISNLAINIYNTIRMANNIFPSNQHEVQKRKDLFVEARGMLYALVSQIEVANELFTINGNAMNEWSEIINAELKLLKGVMKNDRDRYKHLKE